jgi:bifunctional ADP-heptose synthase (sugar kinase/adenylyltransferase)
MFLQLLGECPVELFGVLQRKVATSNTGLVRDDNQQITRVIGNSQQVVRLDFETENECLNEEIEQKLLDAVKRALPEVDIVVISDYGKGVCNDTVCQQVISASAGQGKKVIIDPKGTNWEKYRSATIITPNLKEQNYKIELELSCEE